MRIAVLGWGSLIWNPRALALVEDWQTGGPTLSIEFSRISRDGRLTLVIDEASGTPVVTRYAASVYTNLDKAIRALKEREDTIPDRIGFVNLISGMQRTSARVNHPAACETIKTWAAAKGWDAAIWTALPPDFEQKRREPFSANAALRYLKELKGAARQNALEYLTKAPPEVDTPVRRLFRQDFA